jgi:hypothetical protein
MLTGLWSWPCDRVPSYRRKEREDNQTLDKTREERSAAVVRGKQEMREREEERGREGRGKASVTRSAEQTEQQCAGSRVACRAVRRASTPNRHRTAGHSQRMCRQSRSWLTMYKSAATPPQQPKSIQALTFFPPRLPHRPPAPRQRDPRFSRGTNSAPSANLLLPNPSTQVLSWSGGGNGCHIAVHEGWGVWM